MSGPIPPDFNAGNLTVEAVKAPVFIAQKSLSDETIKVNNFWFFPDVYLLDFQREFKTNKSISNEEQLNALKTAVIWVNDDLCNAAANNGRLSWLNEQIAAGVYQLDDVPARRDSMGVSERSFSYLNAVYSKAKALLLASFPDIDSTKGTTKAAGLEFETSLEKQIREHETKARLSIRFVMGKGNYTVELI